MKDRTIVTRFGSVLKQLRESAGLTQEQLADKSHLDRTYISQLERSQKIPTLQTFLSLSQSLNIPANDLMAMVMPKKDGDSTKSIKNQDDHGLTLPIYGTGISCGRPITEDHVITEQLVLDDLLVKDKSQTFFVKASGDSMLPSIQDGDYLVIDSSHPPKSGDAILVQIDGEFAIKRYYKRRGGEVLTSDNPDYDRVYKKNDGHHISICGVVSSSVRLTP